METSTQFFSLLLSLLFSFTCTAFCASLCPPASCGETGPVILFPFWIQTQKPDRCGYPGFDLSCDNNNQTILTLPYSGQFTVTQIDYTNQSIYINDPDSCLPKRFMNFSLLGTRFRPVDSRNYTFFNCSASKWPEYILTRSVPVFCLGSENYTVIAMESAYLGAEHVPAACRNFSTVVVPAELSAVSPVEDVQLKWQVRRRPSCGECEAEGGTCGYMGEPGGEIGCFNLPSSRSASGLPRSAKYGIIIGAGIPGLVCLIGLACYAMGKIRTYGRQRELDAQLSAQLSNMMNSQPVIVMGLDGPTIESYPKTVLGESRRLPKPNDGTCPICLGEYQPKETLRTIPECNHYFHVNCIDEWLRMNATCPLCRNSPAESSIVTPSSLSMSSSSSSSS